MAGPGGPDGQAPPEHYRAGPVAPTSSECPPHRRCADLPLSGDAPPRPLGWEPGNRLCAPLPRYSERPSRRTCGRVHIVRTISPWQSAAHDPAGDRIRNAGGRGTRRLAADWWFTGLRDPRSAAWGVTRSACNRRQSDFSVSNPTQLILPALSAGQGTTRGGTTGSSGERSATEEREARDTLAAIPASDQRAELSMARGRSAIRLARLPPRARSTARLGPRSGRKTARWPSSLTGRRTPGWRDARGIRDWFRRRGITPARFPSDTRRATDCLDLCGTPLDAILHRRGWRSRDSLVVRWHGAFEEWFGGSVETGTTYPSVSVE